MLRGREFESVRGLCKSSFGCPSFPVLTRILIFQAACLLAIFPGKQDSKTHSVSSYGQLDYGLLLRKQNQKKQSVQKEVVRLFDSKPADPHPCPTPSGTCEPRPEQSFSPASLWRWSGIPARLGHSCITCISVAVAALRPVEREIVRLSKI